MNRWALFLCFAACSSLGAAVPALGPLPADNAARSMVLPDGFRAEVFAAEPDVVQPISFCTDARGRIFVAEALNYGTWRPTGKDRIVILERTEDGRGVRRKVFYEGFNYVTGIEVGFGGVWVMSPPRLYFIPDRNGDDIPDGEPEVVFDGFGYKESRHNLANGFTWGPDGWLYAGHGRTSPSDVGPPGTPADQRVHCDGGVYRVHPTRRVFENFTDGTTNPWGVDFDDLGQCFVSNCVDPHLFHMIQGGHYEPWRGRPSSRYAYERLPTIADHLHYPSGKPREMRGETAETLAMGGGHSHCGTLVYLADQFPARYRNTVFMCNIHGRRINNDILHRKGSGYTASHGKDFMIAADPWFMGVTLRTGPDGSVLVSDWSDTGECHTYKPNLDTARIYRLSYGPARNVRVDLARSTDDELVKLQLHANDWYVRHARRLLQERAAHPGWKKEPVHAALRALLEARALGVPQRLRALWALHVTGGLDAARLRARLADPSEHVRAWSVQLLCETPPAAETLHKLAALAQGDPSPVVRLYLASALQRLPIGERWSIAAALLSRGEDRADANLSLMIWYGLEPAVPTNPARAVQLARAARLPLVRQHIARRLVDEAVAQGTKDELRLVTAALADVDESAQLDLLEGIRDGLRGRKSMPMPGGWPAIYDRLIAGTSGAVREQTVLLALIFGDPRALADLRRTALTTAAPTSERVAALEALINQRAAGLAPVLHQLLTDAKLRRSALRGLAAYVDEATPARVLAHYAEFSAEEKQDAVATLAARKEYAVALLDAVAKKVVARADLSAYVARQLHALGDRQVTERLRQVWGEVREAAPKKREQIARYKAMLSPGALSRADLSNGRLLFSKMCQQCHMLYGQGNKIGPDLTGSNRSNLDYLLGKIIDPSAEVSKDYRLSIVTTVNGRVLTGMIVDQTAKRLTLQTATERIDLAREDVEEVRASQQSLMPEGQLDPLTRDQVRELVAYLSAKTQVPLPTGASTAKPRGTPR
jgi:putative membrane-bound dehydrogenase-like protein